MPDPIADLMEPRFVRHGDEQLGTKEKAWYREEGNDSPVLWKEARQNTGEHWSEHLAFHLAGLLGVTVAHMRPAVLRDPGGNPLSGTISERFLSRDEQLLHGNELMLEADPAYPAHQLRRVKQHRVDAVLGCLAGMDGPGGEPDGARAAFVGYLTLDAWILNVDRHHQNWAAIRGASGRLRLAPSYDHASSLGRELPAARHRERLTTRDTRADLAAYIRKAKGGWFMDGEAIHPVAAWVQAGQILPGAAGEWRERLAGVSVADMERALGESPAGWMPDDSANFVRALLTVTQRWLVKGMAP